MTTEEQQGKNMTLEEVIKKRLKEDKTGKIRPLLNKRRRRFFLRRKYNEENPKKDNRRRIIVENLNKDMQNPDLIKLFEQYGKLTRCGIKFDKLGISRRIADIEFSTHEECEKAISTLDNADINGEKIRVKYAPNSYGRFSRRSRSAGTQRRNLRRLNRSNRRMRGTRTRRMRLRRTRPGASGRKNFRPKRRFFARTLGRRRPQKKQN